MLYVERKKKNMTQEPVYRNDLVVANQYSIIGCGGHARSVADVLIDNDPTIRICFYDENARINETILDDYSVKRISDITLDEKQIYFVAIGDNGKRKLWYERLNGCSIEKIVSKRAYVSHFAVVSEGCFVGDCVHIGPDSIICENTIINSGANIDHECRIGRHTHISVGAKICGRASVGDEVMVGAGAVIIDKINICDNVIIGAGAVVISDIESAGTYVGTPAKRIK